MCGHSFSIIDSTKKLWPEEIEMVLESDSNAYSEDKGEKMLQEERQEEEEPEP
jgi:hypothetical protein